LSEEQAGRDRELSGRAEDHAELAGGFARLAGLPQGDPGRRELRDRLVTACLPLAYDVASRYRDRGRAEEELRRVAVAALADAVDRYRPDRGDDFLAFAVPVVMGEVRRYCRDAGRAPRAARPLAELLGPATAELAQRLNRAPTARELAEHLHVGVEDVYEGVVAASAHQAPPPPEPADAAPRTTAVERVDGRESIGGLLDGLDERDREIVLLRFDGGLSQSRIAERLGLSQLEVSDRLSHALARLREHPGEPDGGAEAVTRRRLRAGSAISDKVGPVEHPAAQRSSGGESTQLQEATVAETGRQPAQPDRIDEVPTPATMQLTGAEFGVAAESIEPAFTVLRVSGEVDMVAAPELTEHVQQHFRAGSADRTLVFDLTDVTFLASAGLAVLAEAANLAAERGTTIRVVAPSRSVTRPLEVAGLDRVLPTYADLASAIEDR
jgi:RNA polymerase sigma-B factor